MRTKILLTAAAALAAGLVSSNAQVYSANVVGYYNVTMPAGQQVLAGNQLVGTTNDLNTLLPSLPNKSSVQIWTGTGFTTSAKGAGGWSPDATVPVGAGFFVKSGSTVTNTFVGSVIVGPGESVTNTYTGGANALIASPIPYATTLNDTNNLLGLSTLPNKSSIQIWNGNGFTTSAKGAGGWSPDENISVGQGFFLKPNATASVVQTLPSN